MRREDEVDKWDRKYAAGQYDSQPSPVLCGLAEYLPRRGRALDVAGGAGRHALWLAKQGLEVTLADSSRVGLELASEAAAAAGLALTSVQVDVERDGLPPGPWDLIHTHLFLYRPLFRELADQAAAGCRLIVIQPTVRNLERHTRPPRPFLLEEGELPGLLDDRWDVLLYREGWLEAGRHEAVLAAELLPIG